MAVAAEPDPWDVVCAGAHGILAAETDLPPVPLSRWPLYRVLPRLVYKFEGLVRSKAPDVLDFSPVFLTPLSALSTPFLSNSNSSLTPPPQSQQTTTLQDFRQSISENFLNNSYPPNPNPQHSATTRSSHGAPRTTNSSSSSQFHDTYMASSISQYAPSQAIGSQRCNSPAVGGRRKAAVPAKPAPVVVAQPTVSS